jgi:hypothetical protein
MELGEAVRRAVISGNVFRGRQRIANRSKLTLDLSTNVGD